MSRWKCWNCLKCYPKTVPHPVTLCHVCYNSQGKNPEIFHQRDPFFKHREELERMKWKGLNRVRKPPLEVKIFFDRINKIRRKVKMLFRLTLILSKLQKETSERVYAPGGVGFQQCQQRFELMALS